MRSEPLSPMTLGNAAAARVRLIVWCLDCRHQVEPDPAEMAERYSVLDWRSVEHSTRTRGYPICNCNRRLWGYYI